MPKYDFTVVSYVNLQTSGQSTSAATPRWRGVKMNTLSDGALGALANFLGSRWAGRGSSLNDLQEISIHDFRR